MTNDEVTRLQAELKAAREELKHEMGKLWDSAGRNNRLARQLAEARAEVERYRWLLDRLTKAVGKGRLAVQHTGHAHLSEDEAWLQVCYGNAVEALAAAKEQGDG